MTDTEEFEQKLDQLIATCQQLKRENASLREREAGLVGERGALLEQNEMARKKIKVTHVEYISSNSANYKTLKLSYVWTAELWHV